MVYAVRQHRDLLYGREWVLRTDHEPLKYITKGKDRVEGGPCSRLMRWSLILSEFQFTIESVPGRHHADADAVSRLTGNPAPIEEELDDEEEMERMTLPMGGEVLLIAASVKGGKGSRQLARYQLEVSRERRSRAAALLRYARGQEKLHEHARIHAIEKEEGESRDVEPSEDMEENTQQEPPETGEDGPLETADGRTLQRHVLQMHLGEGFKEPPQIQEEQEKDELGQHIRRFLAEGNLLGAEVP